MAPGLKNKTLLDPEECWKEWIAGVGSLGKIQEKLLLEGRINRKTGNPPTKSAIQKAAFMWVTENTEEARRDLEFSWSKEGEILTDEEWKKFLFKAGRLVYYQRMGSFRKFISFNKLENYERV